MYRKGSKDLRKGSKESSGTRSQSNSRPGSKEAFPGSIPEPCNADVCRAEDTTDDDLMQGQMAPHSKVAWTSDCYDQDCNDQEEEQATGENPSPPGGYGEVALFTANIIIGIIGSQVTHAVMPHDVYNVWYEVVGMLSLLCLSFIMINVGYEFTIDKSKIRSYGVDTGVAMTAAGFPWLFVAGWFIWVLPNPLPWKEALVAARFAAPTSAGVLFCMLEAAGLKETWLFQKARILAIFDDLDTILFMVPLKAILIGLKWELFVILAVVFGLLVFGYKKLHQYRLPKGWRWTIFYAIVITAITEVLYWITNYKIAMEAIHIEVLLPAFILGVVIETEPDDEDHEPDLHAEAQDEKAKTVLSAIFMVLVGFSMPPLVLGEGMSAGAFVGHVIAVSVLMVLGKMFPVACYQKEATLRTRLALAVGMCPRGEVGAGVILISLDLGIKGEAVGVAIVCLALNMVMTGGFIMTVKQLVTAQSPEKDSEGSILHGISRRISHVYGRSPNTTQVTPLAMEDGEQSVPNTADKNREPKPLSPKSAKRNSFDSTADSHVTVTSEDSTAASHEDHVKLEEV